MNKYNLKIVFALKKTIVSPKTETFVQRGFEIIRKTVDEICVIIQLYFWITFEIITIFYCFFSSKYARSNSNDIFRKHWFWKYYTIAVYFQKRIIMCNKKFFEKWSVPSHFHWFHPYRMCLLWEISHQTPKQNILACAYGFQTSKYICGHQME